MQASRLCKRGCIALRPQCRLRHRHPLLRLAPVKGGGRRVRKKLLPPLVGNVALEVASQILTAESYGAAYTSSADEQVNQLCSMFHVDDEPSFMYAMRLSTVAVVLMCARLSFCGLRVQICLTRRPRPVEASSSEQATTASPPTMCSQSDSSDGEEHFPAFKEVCSVRRLAEIFE